MNQELLITTPESEYALLDSGEGEKLEQLGGIVLARPDPQALWPKQLPTEEWAKADGVFSSKSAGWKFKSEVPRSWTITFGGLQFLIRPSSFKHTGLFPEQRPNWEWIRGQIETAQRDISVLNLFGYTGGATLAAAAAGAAVTHLDGSKAAISWARENVALSGLSAAPIRWILDDARAFVRREMRRGKHYDGIILDPPAFGRGPKGEVWKIEDNFLELVDMCKNVLSNEPLFFLINGYAAGYSAIAYANTLAAIFADMLGRGSVEIGELAIAEAGEGARLLPAGIFARISW